MNIPRIPGISEVFARFAVKTQNAEKPCLNWKQKARQESRYEQFCVHCACKVAKKIPILDTFEAVVPSLALRQLDTHHSTTHDQLIGDDYGR